MRRTTLAVPEWQQCRWDSCIEDDCHVAKMDILNKCTSARCIMLGILLLPLLHHYVGLKVREFICTLVLVHTWRDIKNTRTERDVK